MSNLREMVKRSSSDAVKVVRIAKMFCIIIGLIAIVGGFLTLVNSNNIVNAFENNPEFAASFTLEHKIGLFSVKQPVTMIQDLDKYLLSLSVEIIKGGILFVLAFVVLVFIQKVFRQINKSESPFDREIFQSLKIAFVLLSLICLMQSVLLGLVIAFILKCFYDILNYGCELQQESDETL